MSFFRPDDKDNKDEKDEKEAKRKEEMQIWYVKVDALYDFVTQLSVFPSDQFDQKYINSSSGNHVIAATTRLKEILDNDRNGKATMPEKPQPISAYYKNCLRRTIDGILEYYGNANNSEREKLSDFLKERKIDHITSMTLSNEVVNYLEGLEKKLVPEDTNKLSKR
jgi:hypothetical protein